MDLALAVVPSVAIVAGCSLVALRMVLAHKAREVVHAPIAQLEQKLNELENRILQRAMGR